MQKIIYCLTCKKSVDVKETVCECEKEIVFMLMCGHERHIWLNKKTRLYKG